MVKVEGTSFLRDINSMGLSNVNPNERDEYYAKVRMLKNQKEEINKVRDEINDIRYDISEIKNLLSKLIDK